MTQEEMDRAAARILQQQDSLRALGGTTPILNPDGTPNPSATRTGSSLRNALEVYLQSEAPREADEEDKWKDTKL